MALSPFKKFLVKATLVIVLLLTLTYVFLYFGSYSDGYRAGTVIKMSRKGYLFKTYEGELNTEGFGTTPGNKLSSVWAFSVDTSQQEVIEAINQAALNKEWVKLYYEEKFVVFFWRGETKYFVTKVESIEGPQ